jgi:UDP-GlcNAc:polypeptide alpha-N-acetylglucosaminyltransferase
LQQNAKEDLGCVPAEWKNCSKDMFCPSDQVRVRHIDPADAKGPTYGRYLADATYRGEKYYFLMDSHNRFVTHWDDLIIKVYKKAPSPRAVLSHYPEALILEGDAKPLDNRDSTSYMCNAKFIADGYPRHDGAIVHKTDIPRLQPFSAAGMLFADAQMVKEVPFDPHLPFLFDGEEFLYSVRMWTNGWDIYSPSENLMYHFYYREKSHKVWSHPNNNWYHWQRRSVERVQYVLGVTHTNTTNLVIPKNTTADYILIELDKYGLGNKRTMEEYWQFSGVDPVKRTVPSWCGRA